MEPNPTLIWPDRRVKLYSITPVDANAPPIVNPGYAEHDDALRLHKALKKAAGLPFGMLYGNQLKTLKNLANRLKKFRLSGVAFFNVFIYTVQILICWQRFLPPLFS